MMSGHEALNAMLCSLSMAEQAGLGANAGWDQAVGYIVGAGGKSELGLGAHTLG